MRELVYQKGSEEQPVLEFLVLAGRDAGQQFTLDADEVHLGRGVPRLARPGAVLLSDPSVSPDQALIRSERRGVFLEHAPGAVHPTCVNGRTTRRQRLRAGDRIGVGDVVLEVRQHDGGSLGALRRRSVQAIPKGDTTEVRSSASGYGVRVVRGSSSCRGHCFPLAPERTSIGRHESCDVRIPDDRGVSNFHAELVIVDDGLALMNYSTTNPTAVNGIPVKDRRMVTDGDEIQLADQLVLRLEGPGAAATAEEERRPLLRQLEERLDLDLDIEQRFAVEGSFLDVDVADSYGMKMQATRADHIILSFVRWREWIQRIIREFDGTTLNSNGDELMCFFEVPLNAVKSASAVLRRLASFNATENLLSSPFRLRIGVHTGDALVDFERGYAFSSILDVAGHLQKDAEVDGLLISEHTLRALPGAVSFAPAGKLEREGIATFRLTGAVE